MAKPKIVQAKRSFLLAPISESEASSIILSRLQDIYGNVLDPQTDFQSVVYLTLNPGSDNEEIISFTDGTLNDDGSFTIDTGIVRHLAAKSPYDTTGTPQSHAAGEDVVVSNEPQFYKAILDYIDSLVLAAAVAATKTTNGYVKLTETNQNSRVRAALVSERSTPGLTVAVSAFSITSFDKDVDYAGGNSPAMVAPVSNPRIDLVVYDTVNTVIAVRTGTEGASPSRPTPTTGDIPLAAIYHRVATTKIVEQDDSTNSYILRWFEPAMYKTGVVTSDSYDVFTDTDQSQTTQNGTVAVGEANATTKHSLLAQSFVPSIGNTRGVTLYKSADTGSFTGTVKVALQANSSGNPSGSDLASLTITNAAWLKLATGEFSVQFSSEYSSMTAGSLYWIVVTTSTSDNSNHPNLGINTAGGYASGSLKYNNSTDGWVSISTSILYFKELGGRNSKIAKTNTSGEIFTAIRPYSLLASDFTHVANSGTSETVAFSKNIPGGTFGPNSGIRATIQVSYNSNSGATITFKLKYNGTTLASSGGAGSLTNGAQQLTYHVINQSSVSSQKAMIHGITANGGHQAAGGTTIAIDLTTSIDAAQTSAADLSAPGLLEFTIQTSSTASSQNCSYEGCIIEKIG